MADIRRLVKLIVDKRAAKKVEKETQRALKKGTDPKAAQRNLRKVSSALNGVVRSAAKLAAAFAAAFAARALFRFLRDSNEVAAEAEAIWNRLGQAVENAGESYADVRPEIEATAKEMQALTRVGDEQFAEILTELISTTNDYSASLKEVGTVANLAAAKQIEMKTAAQLVGRAMIGETGTLSRYGIIVQEGADAMEILRKRFRGFAENEAKTLQGRVAQLTNAWDDLKQAVGTAMQEVGNGADVVVQMTAAVQGLTGWIEDNAGAIRTWGEAVAGAIRIGGKFIELMAFAFVPSSRPNAQPRIPGFDVTIAEVRAGTAALEDLNKLGRQLVARRIELNKIKPFRLDFDRAQAELQNVETAINRVIIARRRLTAPSPAPRTPPTEGTSEAKAPPAPSPQNLEAVGMSLADLQVRLEDFTKATVEHSKVWNDAWNIETFDEAVDKRIIAMQRLQFFAEDVALGFSDAWQDGFALMFDGLDNLGEFTDVVARGMAGSLLGSLAQVARGEALSEVAKGISAAASAWVDPTGSFGRKAAGHFASAAAWGVLAGFTGAAGNAVAGGRGGGGSSSASQGGNTTQPQGPEINIYVDPLDPENPAYQANVDAAQRYARERFGDSRVSIRRRGR